jgi:hypothetical protein
MIKYLCILIILTQVKSKEGKSFLIVGDYGQMANLNNAYHVFDGINKLK